MSDDALTYKDDIQPFVSGIWEQVGSVPGDKVLRALYREGIGEIFRITKSYVRAWDNGLGWDNATTWTNEGRACTLSASDDMVVMDTGGALGFEELDIVRFQTSVGGVTVDTDYYVRSPGTASTGYRQFQVSLTSGVAAVNLTAAANVVLAALLTQANSLALVDNHFPYPSDCYGITRVEYSGSDNPMEDVTQEYLDRYENGWRTTAGDPDKFCRIGSEVWLNSIPAAPTVGKLVVRGYGTPTDDDQALRHIPEDLQLGPAYFMLAHMPFNATKAEQVALKQQYELEWYGQPGNPGRVGYRRRLIDAARQRTGKPFRYR